MTANPKKNERPPLRVLPGWVAVIGVAAVAVSITGTTVWLLSIAGRSPSLRIEAIQIGLTLGAGAGGAIALLFTFRRQWLSERAQVYAEDDATQRRITELYAKAVEELGHDKAPVRLGGLYALERLAQDQSVYRQTVVDVVCAYLRMPFQAPADASGNTTELSPGGHFAIQKDNRRHESIDRQELQVRLAAQWLLARHLTVPDNDTVGLPETYWKDIRINLTGAVLTDFNFYQCHAYSADFHGAQFTGDTSFSGAQFSGNSRFGEAQFSGAVRFKDAQFGGVIGSVVAEFEGAHFGGDAQFDRAQFTGDTWFGKAQFTRDAGFIGAQFTGDTQFEGAQFGGDTRFYGARFTGEARFGGAQFTGAGAFFDEAQFGGGAWFGGDALIHGGRTMWGPGSDEDALFDGARFSEAALFGGDTSFTGARFTGAAWFGGVQFSRHVLFDDAQFSDVPSFREARASYASHHVWPPGWHIEPPSSSSAPIGRLISDITMPAPPAASENG